MDWPAGGVQRDELDTGESANFFQDRLGVSQLRRGERAEDSVELAERLLLAASRGQPRGGNGDRANGREERQGKRDQNLSSDRASHQWSRQSLGDGECQSAIYGGLAG